MGAYLKAGDLPDIGNADANELINELEVHLSLHYPLGSIAEGDRPKLKALLIPIIRRWHESGTGLVTTDITGPFTERKSGGGGHVLWEHEKNNIRKLCGQSTTAATSRGSFPDPEPMDGLYASRPGWVQ